MSLSTTIKSIQDIMRKDVGVDGNAQRIGQIAWMLYLKIYDDKDQEFELLHNNYRSPIPKKYQWRSWAADPEGLTGDSLLEFVNNELFPKLKEIPGGTNGKSRGYVVRGVFEDAYQYMKNGTLLRQVINKMNDDIDFNDSKKRHLFGDIYEQILKDLQSAGNAGEYYTPGAKSYNKTKPINIAEFAAEKKWWGQPDARGGFKGRKSGEQAWKVSAADIWAGGYNLDIKNPHDADSGPGDPDEMLKQLKDVRKQGQDVLQKLKAELAAALGGHGQP